MAEYIDRDHYCKYICRCNGDKCDKTKCPLFTAPTADVAQVVHREWKQARYTEASLYICSGCDKPEYKQHKYCPHCGAKMDGGKK